MPKLIGISGQFAGKAFIIANANGLMMGRDDVSCQVNFAQTVQGVSRHHCVIKFNYETKLFILSDIGSTYGTFLANGAKIESSQPVALKHGERFYLGSTQNMFEVAL